MYKHVHHITAGAGAGKTTTLVRIITRLVKEEGADPQRMILSTFTDAAATEFREKSKAALAPEDAVRMNGATMGTLHSIAGQYIHRYWYLLGISPSVKPVSKSVSDILMNRSLEGIVNGEQKALLNRYVETFGITTGMEGYDYDFWKKTLRDLFDKMRGYGFGKDRIPEFRDRTMKLLRDTFTQDPNVDLFDQKKSCLEKYLGYKGIIEANGTDSTKDQYASNCVLVNQILSLDPFKVNCKELKKLEKMQWGRPHTIKVKGPTKDQYETEINECKGEVASSAVILSKNLVPADYSMIFDVAELLFHILDAWIDAYAKIKNETGVIDFADMEELFLRLLEKKEVLEDIHESVDYLFVDEFQDSSPIQTRIYEILSNHIRKQAWFVGDRKQAIYGFAGSDAGLVAELISKFPVPVEDSSSLSRFKKDDNGNSSQVLGVSRRSVPSLVHAANSIFVPAFADTRGIKKDIIPKQHVWLDPDDDKEDNKWDSLYHINVENEAALATFICKIAESDDFRKAGYTLSDIAILARNGFQVNDIGKALVKKNIPTAFVDPGSFIDTPEVSLVLAILRLSEGIDVEKSRAEIRKLILDEDLAILSAKVGKGENNLDGVPGLESFAKSIRSHSVLDRINEIITRFDLYGVCGHWGNPDARRGNLNLLRQVAEEYEDKSVTLCAEADVRGYLSFLKDCKPQTKFDNSAEGVKVLTYHKSKGLDWKIVILCGLDDYKEESSISGVSVLGSSREPEGILAIPRLPDKDWVDRCIEGSSSAKEILDVRRAVQRGEEKRLLYVGFTRAKEVVITASENTSPGVIQSLCPTACTRTAAGLKNDEVDIWGIPGRASRFAIYEDEPDLMFQHVTVPEKYKDAGFSLSAAPVSEGAKYHSPSKYSDPVVQAAVFSVKTVKDFGARIDIPHGHLNDNVFGDCIHHIFARCMPGMHDANLAIAESTLKGFGIQDPSSPEKVVAGIEAFFNWLMMEKEETYGRMLSLEQEVPLQYTDLDGHVFSGNMDLVWRTEKGCVLVDYKTFPGKRSDLFNKESHHWAGRYASQLKVYADALSASECKAPLDCLLYYPVEGLVVRVE